MLEAIILAVIAIAVGYFLRNKQSALLIIIMVLATLNAINTGKLTVMERRLGEVWEKTDEIWLRVVEQEGIYNLKQEIKQLDR